MTDLEDKSGPCSVCKELCEPFAANPGRWPSFTGHREYAHLACAQDAIKKARAYDQLLGFVTRMCWRKPELNFEEALKAIMFYPDVRDEAQRWFEHGVKANDLHLLTKLNETKTKRGVR